MFNKLLVLTLVALAASGCSSTNWSRMEIGPRPDQPTLDSYWCYTNGSNQRAPLDRRGPGVGWCVPNR